MKRLFSILLLLNFVFFTIPISTNKGVARQLLNSMPAEEEHGHAKGFDINENSAKLLHQVKYFSFSKDIFYLLSKERFSHYILHTFPVDWLETFSPPPDIS